VGGLGRGSNTMLKYAVACAARPQKRQTSVALTGVPFLGHVRPSIIHLITRKRKKYISVFYNYPRFLHRLHFFE